METVPVYVGLDYHARSIQVCVMDSSGRQVANRRCGNSVMEVVSSVGPGCRVVGATVESCCGASDLAEALREEAGWPVSLAHPGYVARMKHNPDKSDYSDARMLAELCRAGMVPTGRLWCARTWRSCRTSGARCVG